MSCSSWGVSIDTLVNYRRRIIRVLTQHEFDWFDEEAGKSFFSEKFTLSHQSNRMAYRLDGPEIIPDSSRQLLSAAVQKGTIQVTSGGSAILLMSDAQTTGGYPRIAQVAAADIPVCAQLQPGEAIQFEKIGLAEAESAYLHQQAGLLEIENAIRSQLTRKPARLLPSSLQ